MIAKSGLDVLESEVAGEFPVVANLLVRIERKMVPCKREIRVHRRLHYIVFAASKTPDATTPGDAVMNDQQLRSGFGRRLHALHAAVHGERDLRNVVASPRDLESVIRDIIELPALEQRVTPVQYLLQFHSGISV